MKKLLKVSTTVLALALVFLLVACDPPTPPEPEDPTPVVPDPVEDVLILEGEWLGAFSFVDEDLLGNEEELVLGAIMSVTYLSGNLDGTMVLDTDDSACSIGGTQEDSSATLIVFCEELQAFSLSGEVGDGIFAGNYTTTGTILENGVFEFSYTGGE